MLYRELLHIGKCCLIRNTQQEQHVGKWVDDSGGSTIEENECPVGPVIWVSYTRKPPKY